MVKRVVAAPLWFVSVWCMVELVLYFVGGPRILGPLVGAAAAAFAVIDPSSRLWRADATVKSPGRLHGASAARAPERLPAH